MSKRLGDILIEEGHISETQLHRALTSQLVFGGHLGTSLLELGYLDETTLGETLSSMFHVPYARTDSLLTVPYSVVGALPVRMVEKHKVVPLRLEGRSLHLAMIDPKNLHALDEISFVTGHRIIPWVAPEVRILEAMEVHYNCQRTRRFAVLARELTNLVSPRRKLSSQKTGDRRGAVAPAGKPLAVQKAAVQPAQAASVAVESGEPGMPRPPLPGRRREQVDYWEKYGYGKSWQDIADGLDEAEERDEGEQVDTRPQRATRLPVTPESGRTPSSMETFRLLAEAASVDEIIATALAFVSARLPRSIMFVVRPDGVMGWEGRGDQIEESRVKKLRLPDERERASILSLVGPDKPYYLGRLPAGWGKTSLYEPLGIRPPRTVLLVPIHIKDRVTAYLYADGGDRDIRSLDLESILSVCSRTGFALQIIILRNKILSSRT